MDYHQGRVLFVPFLVAGEYFDVVWPVCKGNRSAEIALLINVSYLYLITNQYAHHGTRDGAAAAHL